MIKGKWFEVVYEDGVRLNTIADSEQDAIAKAPKYHKSKVISARDLTKDTAVNNKLF